ncbi:MAG: corrinoid protein [Oscillospiraceae bacterium]|jgi:5-methyltetrahydrofolate--homocysteine methyltransferase|nr:corrinoid protein [Oscillospiraceae bacterium]
MLIDEISQNLQKGRAKPLLALVEQALSEDIAADTILNDGLLSAMGVVGEKFKNNEVFVPEVLRSARAMNQALELLKPYLTGNSANTIGKAVIGTVKGDQHDIGKNLVAMMLIGAGFEVIDLGANVEAEAFVQAVREHEPAVLGLSALLTTTMGQQKVVIEAIKEAGLRDKVKIMVGGAPVTQEFAQKIGADAFSADAGSAAATAKDLVVGA